MTMHRNPLLRSDSCRESVNDCGAEEYSEPQATEDQAPVLSVSSVSVIVRVHHRGATTVMLTLLD